MLQAHPMAWIADRTWPGDGMEWYLTQVRAHRQCTDREGWLMRTSEMEGGRACICTVSNLSCKTRIVWSDKFSCLKIRVVGWDIDSPWPFWTSRIQGQVSPH